jgi:serine/threonine-protein kinase RsbW
MKEAFEVLERLAVPSDFEHVGQVEGLIDKICAKHGVDEDNYGNVLIAVTEAFNNAIIHGHKLDSSKNVDVAVLVSPKELCFAVKDEGPGFDFENVADPTAPENIEKENGRGIYLMRHLADRVEFEDNGKEVRIFFGKNA